MPLSLLLLLSLIIGQNLEVNVCYGFAPEHKKKIVCKPSAAEERIYQEVEDALEWLNSDDKGLFGSSEESLAFLQFHTFVNSEKDPDKDRDYIMRYISRRERNEEK